ncbi:MAG: LptF/LptG family permease [Phycisphaerales bacterium JB063]
MPWTLYRYILRELLKVLVLTAVVLVTVMSFAAAVKPMQDGLLGPASLVKFVLFTMPTVLGFALPFAGAFSATLVFTRLVADNEVLACCAGGLSYRKVLMPTFGLGLVLTLSMLVLSNTVIPGFWKAARNTIEGDVLGVLVSQLNQNQPYVFRDEGLVLYAQRAQQRVPTDTETVMGLIPQQYIELQGVAFGQFDKNTGEVFNDTTASRAGVLLIRDEDSGRSYITLRLKDPMFYNARTGELRSDQAQFGQIDSDPIYLPNPVEDKAVFFTLEELIDLWGHPDRYDRVREAKTNLAAAVERQEMRLALIEALSAGRPGEGFVLLRGGIRGDHYMLSAPRITQNGQGLQLDAADGLKVTIDRYNNAELSGVPELRFEAEYGEITITTSEFSGETEAELTLLNVTVTDPILPDSANQKGRHEFAPMGWMGDLLPGEPLETMSARDLGVLAKQERYSADVDVREGTNRLAYEIMKLTLSISAQAHTRAATAVACLLLIVLGAVLAIRMKGRIPLIVFFWSFLLAMLTLLMIYAGQNMATDLDPDLLKTGAFNWQQVAGLGVLWGGNLVTLIVIGREYCRIART